MVTRLFLLAAALLALFRARRAPSLRPASRALTAFAALDTLRLALHPAVAAWDASEPLTVAEQIGVRLDGWLVAGPWPGLAAWLLVTAATGRALGAWTALAAFSAYGVVAVAGGRLVPATWPLLLAGGRLVVGALAWQLYPRLNKATSSERVGALIAACQVAGAAFLWSDWADVRCLSALCWAGCGWIAWRVRY